MNPRYEYWHVTYEWGPKKGPEIVGSSVNLLETCRWDGHENEARLVVLTTELVFIARDLLDLRWPPNRLKLLAQPGPLFWSETPLPFGGLVRLLRDPGYEGDNGLRILVWMAPADKTYIIAV